MPQSLDSVSVYLNGAILFLHWKCILAILLAFQLSARHDHMRHPHWFYFISLEREFAETIQYVEVAPDNSETFSIAYMKLLFSAAVECEIVLKKLCERLEPECRPANINELRDIILRHIPGIAEVKIELPRYSRTEQPWSSWGSLEPKNPGWWRAYNKVKHKRSEEIQEANQANVISAVAGLFAALLYLYQAEINTSNFGPEPSLFEYPSMFPDHIVTRHKLQLP